MALHDKNSGQSPQKNKNFAQSFQHALAGFVAVYLEEKNLRYHLSASVLAITLGFCVRLKLNSWLWLLLVIFLVISSEIWNTVAENLVNLTVGDSFHPIAKKVKDMAAAAVLFAACFAVIVGGILFIPPILNWIKHF